MTSLVEEIKQTAQSIQDAKEVLRKQSRQLLQEGFKKIFEEYPTVGAIRWAQYTPYFNDGDECVFGVNEWEIISAEELEGHEDEGYSYGESSEAFSTWGEKNKVSPKLYKYGNDGYTVGTKPRYRTEYTELDNPNYDPAYGEPYDAIMSIYNNVDQESMKEIFGDHVQVRVTKDGIEVEEYSHD